MFFCRRDRRKIPLETALFAFQYGRAVAIIAPKVERFEDEVKSFSLYGGIPFVHGRNVRVSQKYLNS